MSKLRLQWYEGSELEQALSDKHGWTLNIEEVFDGKRTRRVFEGFFFFSPHNICATVFPDSSNRQAVAYKGDTMVGIRAWLQIPTDEQILYLSRFVDVHREHRGEGIMSALHQETARNIEEGAAVILASETPAGKARGAHANAMKYLGKHRVHRSWLDYNVSLNTRRFS